MATGTDTPGEQPKQDNERLKLWLDFFKWFVGSVALVLIMFLFDWHLKERSTGLEEIKEYSKNIALITNVDNIASRRLLAQFFSNVTASEDLKEGWKDYYKEVDKEYRAHLDAIDSGITANQNNPAVLDSLKQQKVMYQSQTFVKPIVTASNTQSGGLIFIHITRSELRPYAEKISTQLSVIGYKVQGIELVKVDLKKNEVRYLKKYDNALAEGMKKYLATINCNAEVKDISYIGDRAKDGTLEIWLTQEG